MRHVVAPKDTVVPGKPCRHSVASAPGMAGCLLHEGPGTRSSTVVMVEGDDGHTSPVIERLPAMSRAPFPSATNCRLTATRGPEFAPLWRAFFGCGPVTVVV